MNNLDEFHCDTVKIAATVASIYIPAAAGANPIKTGNLGGGFAG
jgi:hypothetical protein